VYVSFSFLSIPAIHHDLASALMLGKYNCLDELLQYSVTHHSQFRVCEQTSSESSVLQQQEIKTQHVTLLIMVNNTVVRNLKGKKQDVSCDENLLHFSLKALCFAGLFPYEKICNTPRKVKLYRGYQITLYFLYCPILFSQSVKLYIISEDLRVAIETVTHILIGCSSYFIMPFINWNDIYKLICKIDMSMQHKSSTHNDKKTTEILRETRRKCTFMSLFVTILGSVLIFCDLYDIFILRFVENTLGVEHKYKGNPNAANVYESLLLEKYPFSCWTPFGEKSVVAHLAIYIYTTFPVLIAALRVGSAASVLSGTLRYTSLLFKLVCKSLEELSNMEDSDKLIEQNPSSTPDKQHMCVEFKDISLPDEQHTSGEFKERSLPDEQHMCEEFKDRSLPDEQHTSEEFKDTNLHASATDGESLHTPSQAQIPEYCNKHKNANTSITTAHCIKDQERKTDSDRSPSDNKSSPEDCVVTIIKNHQEAIW
jgi:hypothetical protein